MKKIIVLLTLMALVCGASAQTSLITGMVRAPDGSPWAATLQFMSRSTPAGIVGALVPTRLTTVAAADGTFSQPLYAGAYTVTVRGAAGAFGWPDSVFNIVVPTNSGVYDVTALMTNTVNTASALYPMLSTLSARGDIYVFNGTNVVRLAAGASNEVLTVDPSAATGLKYATVSSESGGTVASVGATSDTPALVISGSPITSSGTLVFSLASNLTDWAAVPTNALLAYAPTGLIFRLLPGDNVTLVTNGNDVTIAATGGGGGGTGTVTSVGIDSSTLTVSGSPITNSGVISIEIPDSYTSDAELNAASNSIIASIASSNFVNSSQLASSNFVTSAQLASSNFVDAASLASSNYVTSSITNGLAGTNLIYRVLPGTNMVAVTNGWDVTLSSTVSAGGEMTTNFSGINVTNQIWMPNPTARVFVADAPAKKISLYNSFTDASNYEEGFLKWETNVLKLGTAAAGTGVKRNIVLGVDENVFITIGPHPTFPTLTTIRDKFGRDILTFGQIAQGYGSFSGFAGFGGAVQSTNQVEYIRLGPNAGVNQAQIGGLGNVDIGGGAGTGGGAYSTRVGWGAGSSGYGGQMVSYDSFFGYYAGAGRNFGTNNIAVGVFSFYSATDRNRYRTNCIAIGGNALCTTNASASSVTNYNLLVIGHNSGFHVDNMVTNMTIIGHETQANENNIFVINTNQTMVIGGTSRTNGPIQLSATNCVINTPITVNGRVGKSITNTWYSVTSDGSGVVTNRQVFINGILTSWQVNGSEL